MPNLQNQFNRSCTVETAMQQLKKLFCLLIKSVGIINIDIGKTYEIEGGFLAELKTVLSSQEKKKENVEYFM